MPRISVSRQWHITEFTGLAGDYAPKGIARYGRMPGLFRRH